MDGNPYADIIKTMEKEGGNRAQFFRIGKVVSDNPPEVKVDDLVYQGDELIGTGFTPELGQDVLLLPYDEDQRMILLCKVVGL